jgi:putative SOS response-associated peptidase YedK
MRFNHFYHRINDIIPIQFRTYVDGWVCGEFTVNILDIDPCLEYNYYGGVTMCGRFTLVVTVDELLTHYLIDTPTNKYHTQRFNIAPGQQVMAVILDGEKNRLGEFKWGLVPSWAKNEKIGYKMINARAETVAEKPAFRSSFKRQRCLIPADGFYEWKVIDGDKQPMRIQLKDEGIFSMAGLWETWVSPEGTIISSCTIITTTPNELMVDIHDRMPVILMPEDEKHWLDKDQNPKDLKELLRPYSAESMRAYPVSKAVGNVRNQGKELIDEMK